MPLKQVKAVVELLGNSLGLLPSVALIGVLVLVDMLPIVRFISTLDLIVGKLRQGRGNYLLSLLNGLVGFLRRF